MPFCDLRSMSKAGRLREQVKITEEGPILMSFSLHKAELGFFHILEIVT
jgi:hypothetical protein